MRCQICGEPIDGKPFTLSNLENPPGLLSVCEDCAGSERITVEVDGIRVEVDRDDFIQADRERLEYAVGEAFSALEDHGWRLDGVTISARSELSREELD